jgi:uncharacterized membrane protein
MYPAEEWLIIALVLSFIFFCLVSWLHTKGKVRGDLFFWAIFCPTVIFFGTLAAVKKYSNTSDQIMKVLNAFFAWAVRTVGLGLTQLFVALFITALGFGAHYFKRKNQRWYGNVEVVVGFLTALFIAGTLKPGSLDLSKWATLAGAAYVIARGLGNREGA